MTNISVRAVGVRVRTAIITARIVNAMQHVAVTIPVIVRHPDDSRITHTYIRTYI